MMMINGRIERYHGACWQAGIHLLWTKIKNIMNNTNKVITAFLAGATAGALLGILFAPEKGSETRSRIKEQGKKMADDFQDVVEKGKAKMETMGKKMTEQFSKMEACDDVKSN